MSGSPRKSLSIAICLVSLATAATAADLDPPLDEIAYEGWYVRGDIGVAFSDLDNGIDSEDGFAIGGGLGYRFSDLFRADVTFDSALEYDFGAALGSSVNAHSVMGNLYLDIPISFIFRPYIGAGIGWGFVDGGAFDGDGVASATMAGLTYDLPSNGTIDLGYRLRYIDINSNATEDWFDHSVRFGLRFGF